MSCGHGSPGRRPAQAGMVSLTMAPCLCSVSRRSGPAAPYMVNRPEHDWTHSFRPGFLISVTVIHRPPRLQCGRPGWTGPWLLRRLGRWGPPSGLGGGGGYRMPAGRGTPGTCLGAWRLPCIPASHDLACLFGRPQVAAVLGRGAGHPGCLGPAAGDFGAASLRLGRPGPTAAPQPRPEHPGESFRLREKRQAGLFPPQQHLAASREEAGDNYPD